MVVHGMSLYACRTQSEPARLLAGSYQPWLQRAQAQRYACPCANDANASEMRFNAHAPFTRHACGNSTSTSGMLLNAPSPCPSLRQDLYSSNGLGQAVREAPVACETAWPMGAPHAPEIFVSSRLSAPRPHPQMLLATDCSVRTMGVPIGGDCTGYATACG